jgi:hypothetical protein
MRSFYGPVPDFLRLLYAGCGTMRAPVVTGNSPLTDLAYIGLTVLLALSTWGLIVLFARLMKQP